MQRFILHTNYSVVKRESVPSIRSIYRVCRTHAKSKKKMKIDRELACTHTEKKYSKMLYLFDFALSNRSDCHFNTFVFLFQSRSMITFFGLVFKNKSYF